MIPLSNPDITDSEKSAVCEVLNTNHLSSGPKISEFEKEIREFTGVKYAISMSSGTAVLHTIIRSLGIKKGDFILTTSFSFISSSNCLLFEDARPIFVEIDPDTYNLTPENVEKKYISLPNNIKEKTKGILYVDTFGNPADGEGFEELGKKYNLFVIEDSAEALGSSINNRKCGSFGNAALFAFYPNKQITTGEGGILLCNDKRISEFAKSFRNLGRIEINDVTLFERLGYNYRMSDINASLGIAQMSRINELISKRRNVKKIYDNYFEQLFLKKVLFPQKILGNVFFNPFVYVIRLSKDFDSFCRNNIIEELKAKGIQCKAYFPPIHLQNHFKKFGWRKNDFPVTESISDRTIALPFYNNLSEEKIEYIYNTILTILKY
ncbi:MAG: DegT/DnrJ/EryC1/StrS aminotransferase family protein [Ignavibacteriae bacterium]|nr:DegT/DnrJ/EryC1/StrS aminotransferase family protein [Ignavibacteriota bacterium]